MYDAELPKSRLPSPGHSSAHRELTFRLGQQGGATNPNTLFTKWHGLFCVPCRWI